MSTPAIDQTLNETLAQARARPADASVRMQLFRLLTITGQWERASNQLDVASRLDTELAFTTTVYKGLLAGERFRAEVFAGKRTPVVAGEPPQWLAWLIEALRPGGEGESLRAKALELAPANPGRLNGRPFEWIADADSRIGPVLEAYIDGKYYWIPYAHVTAVTMQEPNDWLDLVWTTAEITFAAGATKHAHLPVRYPGTESGDDALRMSRKTVWHGSDEEGWRGLGQRMLATDGDEVGLLDLRELAIDPTDEPGTDAGASAAPAAQGPTP